MTDGLTLAEPKDGAAALAATLAWIGTSEGSDEPFSPGLKPLDASGSPQTLAEYLASENLPDWRNLIVATASPGLPQHIDPALTWLMAHAALEIAVAATRTGLFYAVDELQMLGKVSDANLAAAIRARIGGALNADLLLKRLQARLQSLWESRLNNRLREYAERTAGEVLKTRDLWPRHDGMPMGDGWAHQAAAALWPERYMAMLTELPSLFQSGFAEPLEPLDVDRVATLIRACPAIFSDDGAPLGAVVPFVLLEAIEWHLHVMAADDPPSAEAGVDRLLEAVLLRPDGHWLGRAWLQRIIWRDTPRRAGRAQADVDAERLEPLAGAIEVRGLAGWR